MPEAGFPVSGSSPHTRGARSSRPRTACLPGIIPAYAGSTRWRRRASGTGRDHPRIRGEHVPKAIFSPKLRGSSPHTRGARQTGLEYGLRERIIPAYAGSTMASYRLDLMTQDHPRIRGEHVDYECLTTCYDGSSPHTRGAHVDPESLTLEDRIIPAYAGSTASPASIPATVRDHPRIRGEHPSPNSKR